METFKSDYEACEFETQFPGPQNLEEQIREIYNSEDENSETDEVLSQIVKQIGGISTLERQNRTAKIFTMCRSGNYVNCWELAMNSESFMLKTKPPHQPSKRCKKFTAKPD